MAAYLIAQINIHNKDLYQQYLDGFDQIFERFKGRVMAVDDKAEALEGRWEYGRTVLIRFPDRDSLLEWYRSDDYQELARFRREASDANIVLISSRRS